MADFKVVGYVTQQEYVQALFPPKNHYKWLKLFRDGIRYQYGNMALVSDKPYVLFSYVDTLNGAIRQLPADIQRTLYNASLSHVKDGIEGLEESKFRDYLRKLFQNTGPWRQFIL